MYSDKIKLFISGRWVFMEQYVSDGDADVIQPRR